MPTKKSLVIVESPAKANTINKYLGKDFVVKASLGHVKDLPKSKLGVDIKNDFEPVYELIPDESAGNPEDIFADMEFAAELAAAVETVSGRPFERYLSERLFTPAGLRSTGFWGPREHPEVAVIRSAPADTNNLRPNWGFRGGTGMFSTTGDLYRWNAALEDGRVISKTSVGTLFEAHTRTKKGIGVGYGWFTSRTAAGTRCTPHLPAGFWKSRMPGASSRGRWTRRESGSLCRFRSRARHTSQISGEVAG